MAKTDPAASADPAPTAGGDVTAAFKATIKQLEADTEKLLDEKAKMQQELDTLTRLSNRLAKGAGEKPKRSFWRKLLLG